MEKIHRQFKSLVLEALKALKALKSLKALSVLLVPLFFLHSIPPAFAVVFQIPVDCVCVDKKYQVYGEEQPVKQTSRDAEGQKIENCFVTVDLNTVQPIPVSSEQNSATDGLTDNLVARKTIGIAQNIGSIAGGVLSPLAVLFEQSQIKESFLSYLSDFFQKHTQKYHAFMDAEVFGKVIAQVSEFQESKELEEYLKTQEGECKADDKNPNPKPECLAEKALCSYEKYVGALFYQSGESVLEDAVSTENIDSFLNALQSRDQALLEEARQSREALDTALAVYSQFFQSYRLHLRFKEVIVNLARVRDMTGYMRDLVGCIPNKFVGVATTKCN